MPSLASTAADFKQHAETDLPDWSRTALLNNADNSPAGNSQLDAEVYSARAELGRVLFYDNRLSHNDGTSCASDGTFKVPLPRNIAGRDVFVHDGRSTTLEEVIDFYSEGILNDPNLHPLLQQQLQGQQQGGFGFTDEEKADLIAFLAFLYALTDDVFLGTAGGEDLLATLFTDPFVDLPGDFIDSCARNSTGRPAGVPDLASDR